MDRKFVEFKKHRYVIQRHGDVTVDDDDDDDDDRRERSILVSDVPAELVDAAVCLLESERKNGGEVELQKRDHCTGTMLFTFVNRDGQSC